MQGNRITYLASSKSNTFKFLLKLQKRRYRKQFARFVVEGYQEINLASRAGVRLEDIFVSSTYINNNSEKLEELAQNYHIFELPDSLYAKISVRQNPEGLLATAHTYENTLEELEFPKSGLFLIAEGIEKPGNLGAILRSADAVGVDCVFLDDVIVDLFNPNVIRNSRGAVFSVKTVKVDKNKLLETIREHGVNLIASTPSAEKCYWDMSLAGASAICVGNEKNGLSDFWLENAAKANIPMNGECDSLNVSVASSILLYEALRQRNQKKRLAN